MGLGFEKGNAISNMVHCFDEQPMVQTYIQLFNQIWNDPQKLKMSPVKLFDTLSLYIRKIRLNAFIS